LTPKDFEYFVPSSVNEAISLLSKYGDEAKALAGGQSLLLLMKLRLAEPKYLVDLKKIQGLSYIKEDSEVLSIGAMTRHADIESSDIIARKWPILFDTAKAIGHTQIRNRGTIGGSLCHADPSADWLPAMLVQDAEFIVSGKDGTRSVNAREFFIGAFSTVLNSQELMTEIRIPSPKNGTVGSYLKLSMGPGDFAIVSVAIQMTFGDDDICQDVALALGGVNEMPFRSAEAEDALRGKHIDGNAVLAAAEGAFKSVSPISDLRASADYRKRMTRVFTKRAIEQALKRKKQ